MAYSVRGSDFPAAGKKGLDLSNLFIFFSLLALLSSCNSFNLQTRGTETNPKVAENSAGFKLKLKEGSKILLRYHGVELGNPIQIKEEIRTITVDSPIGAEGLTLFWNSSPFLLEGNKAVQKLEGPGAASPNPSPFPPSSLSTTLQVYPLFGHQEGKLTLPNISQVRRMTLPAFWPEGDLYLANTSGIWLSDLAFEELRQYRKTQWEAGLLQNPILGPTQSSAFLEQRLRELGEIIARDPMKLEAAYQISAKRRPGKFLLKVNGKQQEVQVVEAENWLIRYKVLDNPQNPLILEATLAPNLSPGEILFSPLALIKALADYQVLEIEIP
jgi:hypothetical protein